MTVSAIIKRLQLVEADGYGEAFLVIPDYNYDEHGDYFRDGEYAPAQLYIRNSLKRPTVVLE